MTDSRSILPVLLFAHVITALSAPARADDAEAAALVTMEGAAALRERLAAHVLLITAGREAGPLEDAAFQARRHGQAVRARYRGRVRVITSQTLVEGVKAADVSLADGTPVGNARVAGVFEKDGIAELACGACRRELRAGLAAADACADGRLLFFVAPAGDAIVLSHTVVAGPAGDPLVDHVLVPGILPEGMPLFTASGDVAAMVVRPLPGQARSLAFRLCRQPREEGSAAVTGARRAEP